MTTFCVWQFAYTAQLWICSISNSKIFAICVPVKTVILKKYLKHDRIHNDIPSLWLLQLIAICTSNFRRAFKREFFLLKDVKEQVSYKCSSM